MSMWAVARLWSMALSLRDAHRTMNMMENDMTLVDEKATVLQNKNVGPQLYVLELASPRIAPLVQPGQFVHVRLDGFGEHILRRPFSIFDTNPDKGTMTILYQVVGAGTQFMATVQPGHRFDTIGSIGRGWDIPAAGQRVLIVGGGVGAAPLFMLSKQAKAAGAAVDVVLGASTRKALVTYERYHAIHGDRLFCATDDGTFGWSGFCTQPVEKLLGEHAYTMVYTCGPKPLMHAIAQAAARANVSCQVSMEKRMACGVGACLSCVVETTDGRRRACVDGPVFNAEKVIW